MKPYYEHKGITIYHGDCRDILPGLPADVIVTDPPYGVTCHDWDRIVHASEWMVCPCAISTATEPYATELINSSPLPFKFDLVWIKTITSNAVNAKRMPMRRHERVLVFGKYEWNPAKRKRTPEEMSRLNKTQRKTMEFATPDSVLDFDSVNCRSGERTKHPSQKPVELMRWLISSLSFGLVLDPFMGSGTTLRAAKDLGRQAIGIEIEEKYCEIAAKRLSQEVLL